MKLISIIVPVYNIDAYISDCITSILNSTYPEYELIIVNDGSIDSSLEIITKFQKNDSRISIINQDNSGLSVARNNGLDYSNGDYITFIDGDDVISPVYIETLIKLAHKHDADIVIVDYKRFKSQHLNYLSYVESKDEKVMVFKNNISSLEQLYGENGLQFTVSWGKLYVKEIFDDLRFPQKVIHEDEFLAHILLHRSNVTVYSKRKLYYYRIREGSITSSARSINALLNGIEAFIERDIFFRAQNFSSLLFPNSKKLLLLLIELIEIRSISENRSNTALVNTCARLIMTIKKTKSFRLNLAIALLDFSPKISIKLLRLYLFIRKSTHQIKIRYSR